MSEFFSFIFDRLTDPLGLPIEAWKAWLILLVIGAVAYKIAFSIVGDMYDDGWITSSVGGSFFHWVIRLLVFVPIWALTYGVIWVGKLIVAHWAAALAVAGGVLMITVAVRFIHHRRCKGGTSNA